MGKHAIESHGKPHGFFHESKDVTRDDQDLFMPSFK